MCCTVLMFIAILYAYSENSLTNMILSCALSKVNGKSNYSHKIPFILIQPNYCLEDSDMHMQYLLIASINDLRQLSLGIARNGRVILLTS